MAVFSRLRPAFRRQDTDNAGTTVEMSTQHTDEKNAASDEATATSNSSNDHGSVRSDAVDENAQLGVQNIEAITLSWSRTSLIAVFANIWFLYFVHAFASQLQGNLNPYVVSDWSDHSLLNVITVVADAMTAATYIPLAKIMDVWGRDKGFAFMVFLTTLGMVLMAVSTNLPLYCAANVFYSIGLGGLTFCVDVITADASKLKNRALAYAFTSSPYIITAFAGPKAAETFQSSGLGWKWGFGIFAIIIPVVAAPLYFVLKSALRKAQREGLKPKVPNGRTLQQSIWYYFVQFDLLGVIIFSVGLTVFFLPFNIAATAPNGWGTGYIIAMIVVGFVMMFFFAAYEWYLAPFPLLKFSILSDRTVIGACLLDATYQLSYYCWNNYFSSFLQVVNDTSIARAGYIGNTFDVVSGVLLLIVGVIIAKTGRFKWMLYIAVPLYIFAQGLMIYFRRANQGIGYLVMCQIFISIGGSIFIIIEQLAILAAVDHQYVATALALLNVVGTVGDAMGATISGAIWTNTFEKALEQNLPEETLWNIADIYGQIEVQLSYPVGNATRLAIQESYGYSQTRMLAAGTGIMGLALIWIILIRDIDLNRVKQTKGTLF